MLYRCSSFILTLFITVLMTGCSSSQTVSGQEQTSSQESASSINLKHSVNPFAVTDSPGNTLAHPFLGGFNTPRPQFVDTDGDKDTDLFVQEHSNQLMFFEHQTNGSDNPLQWKADHFRDLDIGEWYRFADMDQDGDIDLLAEQPYSYIRYYRNEGSPQQAKFTLAVDTLKDVNGEPIFKDRS